MDSVIAPREDTPEQTYPSNSNQLFEVTSSGDGAPIAPGNQSHEESIRIEIFLGVFGD